MFQAARFASLVALTCSLGIAQRNGDEVPAETAIAVPQNAIAESGAAIAVPVIPIHSAEPDPEGGAYGTWAAGHDYKVEFGSRGIRFVPYLGATAPQTRELRWSTAAIEVGGEPIVDLGAEPTRSVAGTRCEFDWGPVIEAYDVRGDGLEQTFIVRERPARTGDLVVTGNVVSSLTASAILESHTAVTFGNTAGQARIEYGAAFALLPNGTKRPLETSFDGDRIQLRVPAAVLAEADFPLIIDPLISAVTIAGSNIPTSNALDVVLDSQNNRVFVAVMRATSSNDSDLAVLAYDWGFTGTPTTVFADITSSWSTPHAALASSHNPIKIVITLVRHFGPNDEAVRFQVRLGSSLSFSTITGSVPRPAGVYDTRVDVGGLGNHGDHAMLVFERRDPTQLPFEGVMAATIDLAVGFGTVGTPFPIQSRGFGQNLAFYETSRPSITKRSRHAGPSDTWLVAFQERQVTPGTGGVVDVDYIVVRSVSADGSHSAGSWSPSTGSVHTHRRSRPQIGGRPAGNPDWNQYGVAFAERPVGGGAETIAFEAMVWPIGAQGPTRSFGPATLSSPSAPNLAYPGDVGADTKTCSHWFVSTSRGYHRLDRTGTEIEFLPFPYQGNQWFVPGGVDFDRSGGFVTVSGYADWPFGITGSVTGRVYQNPAATAPTLTGPGCSAAQIEWTTQLGTFGHRFDQQIGHDFTQVAVSGTPNGSLHFLVYSLGTQAVDLTGTAGVSNGCWLLVQPTWSVLGIQNGTDVRWDFPLPATLPALTLHFQDWHLAPSGTVLESSERLSVPVVR